MTNLMGWPAKNMALAVVFLAVLVAVPSAQAQFKTLYTFSGGTDGGRPQSRVITDAKGNLYGTTLWGGNLNCNSGNGCGVVYKLTKAGKETVLHSFGGGADGAYPYAALTMDAKGNLYGTTFAGGGPSGCFGNGCGTIFKIDTTLKETVLYSFTGGTDGGEPSSALTMDKAGNFYGTAGIGGDLNCSLSSFGCGVVYKLSKTNKETVLYSFTGPDGAGPGVDSLATDTKGNFYGTTHGGGDPTCACGVVFKLTMGGKETVLHAFTGGATDGSFPVSGVTLDTKGTLYGTTAAGGKADQGVLFRITNPSQAVSHLEDIFEFDKPQNGLVPEGGVNICSNGVIWGTTIGGGLNYGTIYNFSQKTGKEKVIENFDYSFSGGVPLARHQWTQDGDGGIFYGTAAEGGNINGVNGSGTVYSEDYDSRETICTAH